MEMKLIGSRALGIHNEKSDFDYVVLDDRDGGLKDIINKGINQHTHCYHYPRKYREQIAHFNVEQKNDYIWLYNAEDYNYGIIDINPFEYREKWIELMKNIEWYSKYWFIPNVKIVRKRVYHIVYNFECLKANSVHIDAEALSRVKEWHDGKKSLEDYKNLIEEIKNWADKITSGETK